MHHNTACTLEGFLQVDVEEPGDVLRAVAHRQRRDAHGASAGASEATHVRHHTSVLQSLQARARVQQTRCDVMDQTEQMTRV